MQNGPADLMQENRSGIHEYPVSKRASRFAVRFDIREKPLCREQNQQIGYDREDYRGNDVIVVISGKD